MQQPIQNCLANLKMEMHDWTIMFRIEIHVCECFNPLGPFRLPQRPDWRIAILRFPRSLLFYYSSNIHPIKFNVYLNTFESIRSNLNKIWLYYKILNLKSCKNILYVAKNEHFGVTESIIINYRYFERLNSNSYFHETRFQLVGTYLYRKIDQ